MTKDFKNKRTATDTPVNDAVSWVLAGTALGLFIGLMFYLFSGNDLQIASANNANSATNTVENNSNPVVQADKLKSLDDQRSAYLDKVIEEKVTNMAEDKRPRFNYHLILPILDIEVPIARPPEWNEPKKQSSKKTETVEKKIAKKNTGMQYILQVSAHKNRDTALRALKKMRNLGLNAYVKTASVKGETWHRVNIGPLDGAKAAAKAEAYLLEKGVNPPLRKAFK